MSTLIKKWLYRYWPYLLIIVLGIAGTELYKASEGVRGSPFVNQPGALSLIDEGQQLEWTDRLLHGQIPYRDFWTLYTPLRLYFIAGLMKLFGQSILVERIYFALFPLLGFIGFLALVKILTNNLAFAIVATTIIIVGHNVGERNTLFIISLLFLIKAVPFYKNTSIFNFSFPDKKVITCGILTALTFLLSQEFGMYMILGTIFFLLLFFLLRKHALYGYFRFILSYFCGFALIIIPFLTYLFLNNALLNFYHDVFADFSHGAIAQLWVEPLNKPFLFPFSYLFKPEGYLYFPAIQSYGLVTFFIILILFCLIRLIKKNDRSNSWTILFTSVFGLINSRGLFFSQTSSRISDVLTFFFLDLLLITLFISTEARSIKKSAIKFILFSSIFLANWYAISLLPINGYLNNLAEILTFSHQPKGILFDHPRANIRFFPTVLENTEEKYFQLKPSFYLLGTLFDFLELPFSVKNYLYHSMLSNFQSLETKLKQINVSYSQIVKKDNNLLFRLKDLQELSRKLDNDTTEVELAIFDLERTLANSEAKFSQTPEVSDEDRIKIQRQKKYLNYAKPALINARHFFQYLSAELTLEKLNYESKNFSYHFDIANFLAEDSGYYAYGFPLPSVYLFLANKINATDFSPILSNITNSKQQQVITQLEKNKPCRAIRMENFEDKSIQAKDYASLIWAYLEKNYRVVKNIAGTDLLLRNSCNSRMIPNAL